MKRMGWPDHLKAYSHRSLWSSLLAVALSGALIAGCGTEAAVVPSAATAVPELTATPAAPVPSPTPKPFIYPLTGLPADRQIGERPLLVMVENSAPARPQSGLDQADIVYEVLAEGEVTRFAALYQSGAAVEIGPVRSIRPYFVEIGDGFDAMIVHAGWSQDAMNVIAGKKLDHFDEVYGDGKYYWRSKERKAPHNLYTSVELIRKGMQERKVRAEWNGPILSFAEASGIAGGDPATSIKIPYLHGYTVLYRYDAGAKRYLRYMNDKPHQDKVSKKTLGAVNLVVLEAKHRILDDVGRREVNLYGPGNGVLLQGGKKQSITWERKEGAIRLYRDGKELPLLPGQTWIQVVPVGTAVTYE